MQVPREHYEDEQPSLLWRLMLGLAVGAMLVLLSYEGIELATHWRAARAAVDEADFVLGIPRLQTLKLTRSTWDRAEHLRQLGAAAIALKNWLESRALYKLAMVESYWTFGAVLLLLCVISVAAIWRYSSYKASMDMMASVQQTVSTQMSLRGGLSAVRFETLPPLYGPTAGALEDVKTK
jgi:hypothetical protein